MFILSTEHKQILVLILSLIFIISASFYSSLAVGKEPTQSSPSQEQADTPFNTHKNFKLENIIIDPGHGGKDPGNVSPWGGYEKDIVLAVAKHFYALLKENTKFNAHIFRETDKWISLPKRVRMANKYSADSSLLISLHCNSCIYPEVVGLETYMFDLNATDEMAKEVAERENEGEQFDPIDFIINSLRHRGNEKYSWQAAHCIQSTLVKHLKVRDRNKKSPDKKVKRAPFRMLAYTNMPAILIEMGFMSNKDEYKRLSNPKYQRRIAEALLEAVKIVAQTIEKSKS